MSSHASKDTVELLRLERFGDGLASIELDRRRSLKNKEIEIHRMAGEFWTDDDKWKWLESANDQLGGISPIEALGLNRHDDILAMLKRLDDAAYL